MQNYHRMIDVILADLVNCQIGPDIRTTIQCNGTPKLVILKVPVALWLVTAKEMTNFVDVTEHTSLETALYAATVTALPCSQTIQMLFVSQLLFKPYSMQPMILIR